MYASQKSAHTSFHSSTKAWSTAVAALDRDMRTKMTLISSGGPAAEAFVFAVGANCTSLRRYPKYCVSVCACMYACMYVH